MVLKASKKKYRRLIIASDSSDGDQAMGNGDEVGTAVEIEESRRGREGKADEIEGKADEIEGKADEIEGKADEIEGKADDTSDVTIINIFLLS